MRAAAFAKAKIMTVLAVPIFSSGSISPACVLCCYSLVRAEAVPAVLRFVQQALRLLWTGLDKVEPHQSVGKDLWKDVAPADLGEMAADIEMHHAFLKKKRHHSSISMSPVSNCESSLSCAALDCISHRLISVHRKRHTRERTAQAWMSNYQLKCRRSSFMEASHRVHRLLLKRCCCSLAMKAPHLSLLPFGSSRLCWPSLPRRILLYRII